MKIADEGQRRLKLSRSAIVGRFGSRGLFGIGSHQAVIDDADYFEALLLTARAWKAPATPQVVLASLYTAHPDIGKPLFERAVTQLLSHNFLVEEHGYECDPRYDRNLLYYSLFTQSPRSFNAAIAKSSVTILGCGGIGTHVAAILATSGVGHIYLVDDDCIEISNLTRQTRSFRVAVEADVAKIPKSDLLVVSADHPPTLMRWINRFAVETKQAFVNAGYINDISAVGPFYVPGQTACFECAQVVPDGPGRDPGVIDVLINQINEGQKPATFAPVNNIAAAVAASDALKYLGGEGQIFSINRRVGIHSLSPRFEFVEIPLNKLCAICGPHLPESC